MKNVEATPNGGAVMKNTEVTLKCATEGETILYSTDDGQNWTEYTEKIVLSELPMTFKVKAVKEGYEDSNIVTLSYTERTSEKYNLYFGQLIPTQAIPMVWELHSRHMNMLQGWKILISLH